MTWYPQEYTSILMTDMRMRPDPASGYPGRTYRFYTGTPVFRFGYGLSYSKYSYEFASAGQTSVIFMNKTQATLRSVEHLQSGDISYDISNLRHEHCKKLEFTTKVRVSNHGPMDGNHSILMFLRTSDVSGGKLMKRLIAFENVSIKDGEYVHVEFGLQPCEHLSRVGEDGKMYMDEGSHFLVLREHEHEVSIMG